MDLDETMTTSTSSTPSVPQDRLDADDTYNNFPDSRINDPPRTPADDHLNAAAPGELSPPRSQTQSDDNPVNEPVGQSVPNGTHAGANIGITRSAAKAAASIGVDIRFEGQRDDGGAFPTTNNQRDEQPGWTWKNKKAQEEMQRAWDSIVDRDFSLKEYGDVMVLGREHVEER